LLDITFGVITARGTTKRIRQSERMNAILPRVGSRARGVTTLKRS